MILREKAKKRDSVRLSITGSIIILESAPALFLIMELSTAVPAFDVDRARNLAKYASEFERFEDHKLDFKELVENNSRSIVDESQEQTAQARYEMGYTPTITRTTLGETCDWCNGLAGTREYNPQTMSKDVFARHRNCDCLIELNRNGGTEVVNNYSRGNVDTDVEVERKKKIERLSTRRETDFYTGPNGKTLPAQYRNWIGENQMEKNLKMVQSDEVKRYIISDFRRKSFIGDGSTAAIRQFEKATGLNCGRNGNPHTQKVKDLIKQIDHTLLKPIPEEDKIYLQVMKERLRRVDD